MHFYTCARILKNVTMAVKRGDVLGTAATRAKNKWQKENIDRINLTMPKGRKDEIKAYADSVGESVNGFINRAIDAAILEMEGVTTHE